MSEINFYHLTTTPVAKVLPKLLEKLYETKLTTVVITSNDSEMEAINQLIWTYSTKTFIPHGSKNDPFPDQQPIIISTLADPLPSTDALVTICDFFPSSTKDYRKCLDIFDGTDITSLSLAQKRYEHYVSLGLCPNYWQQTVNGSWEKIQKLASI